MIESYDGLCGAIAHFTSRNLQLRCFYDLHHTGRHSWDKYKWQFTITSSCSNEVYRAEQGFLNSVFSK